MVQGLLDAAASHFDGPRGVLGRCLINQVWRLSFSGWPTDRYIRLPFADVSAVSVKYRDGDNAEHTVSSGSVSILSDATGPVVRLSSDFALASLYSDRDDAVQVTFTSGFGEDPSSVPAAIRQAILLLVAHWYKNREAVAETSYAELPLGVRNLISPYRVVMV